MSAIGGTVPSDAVLKNRGDSNSERSKGNQLRPSELLVSGDERNTVDDACRCDNLVGGITGKVQFRRLLTDCDIEGPDVNSGKEFYKFWRVGIERDASQLREFGEFPEDDCGNAPRFGGEQGLFSRL